jgi:hypothetical protein
MAKKTLPQFLQGPADLPRAGEARAAFVEQALAAAASQGRIDWLEEATPWISRSRLGPTLAAAGRAGQVPATIFLLALAKERLMDHLEGLGPAMKGAVEARQTQTTLAFARHAPWLADAALSWAIFDAQFIPLGLSVHPGCGPNLLNEAAKQGRAPAVDALLAAGVCPRPDVLAQAAWGGNPDCVKTLLPFGDPLANHSEPLRTAAKQARHACIELLAPLSNPEDFLQAFKEASPGPNPARAKSTQTLLLGLMALVEKDQLAQATLDAPAARVKSPRI